MTASGTGSGRESGRESGTGSGTGSGTVSGTVSVLGVRHHGPGSARAVVAALDELRPDAVLVEGPSDADDLLGWVVAAGMDPPVALMAYAAADPGRAVFWPFARFSPEWQALRWAVERGVPVRFCDLPSGAVLADGAKSADGEKPAGEQERGDVSAQRIDPIATLAAAAGYDDPERWWDDLVEHRAVVAGQSALDPFAALEQAMAAVRGEAPPCPPDEQRREDCREAQMRRTLREVLKGGARRVAVVCGAWHAPALAGPLPPASRDAAVLRGLPRIKATVTWVPWSHSRLAHASGYGAGITSPGWYHHLFTAPDRPVTRWLTRVAGELRQADLPVSSAHVIEAVRLAGALAGLRGRPLAGLAEVTEATRAVLCEGDETALRLVTDRLVVGEALGGVPDGVPTVPLAVDLVAQARRLRLRQDAGQRQLDLDLRNAIDLDRSRLLHRLQIIGIPWATPRVSQVRSTGTFREPWSLCWRPELAVAVVEASRWGTTIGMAAVARLVDQIRHLPLPGVTARVEQSLLADLPAALPDLLTALDARAAEDVDLLHLMDGLPALVRSLRYGDVRGTDTGGLTVAADALAVRIHAALPAGVTGLDDDAAAELRQRVDAVHEALAIRAKLPGGEPVRDRWLDSMGSLADRDGVPGVLAGRMVRLLLDADRLDAHAAATLLHRALSLGVAPAAKGAWVEGFLGGGGLLLAHDAGLLALIDRWITGLSGQDFIDVLPLLRRTFSTFESGERRTIAEQAHRIPLRQTGNAAATGAAAAAAGWDVDEARGLPAMRAVARLLGADR